MSHVFISYSKRNHAYAYRLADHLQHNGLNVWIDKTGIEYGVDWWQAILTGLKACGAMVVIMTPEALASKWVQIETFLAVKYDKQLFPLLLNGDNWDLFVLEQYADVRSGDLPDGAFIERLSQHVTPATHGTATLSGPPPSTLPIRAAPDPIDLEGIIDAFLEAKDAADWSLALELLGQIRASRQDPFPFDPDYFEPPIQQAIEQERYLAERERRYRILVKMSRHVDAAKLRVNLNAYWQAFPSHDPQNLLKMAVRAKDGVAAHLGGVLTLAEASIVTERIIGGPFEWCEVPAGPFLMGSDRTKDPNAYGDEPDLHEVTLPTFWIAKYPITYSQFQTFIEAKDGIKDDRWWHGLAADADDRQLWEQIWKIAKHPCENVNWYQAMAFCRWLSFRLGGDYAIDKVGEWRVRLPIEAEWEKAARGTDGRIYPWGDTFDKSKANTSESRFKQTTPVDQYPQGVSPYGVLDMSGNVWEWCLSEWTNPYEHRLIKDIEIANNTPRVARGGSWFLGLDHARTAARDDLLTDFRASYWGFRAVVSAPIPSGALVSGG